MAAELALSSGFRKCLLPGLSDFRGTPCLRWKHLPAASASEIRSLATDSEVLSSLLRELL